jgi:bacterioferritin-associated ferredoxin
MDHNESRLQKDFKQRDIQRMRNLITKKFGDKTVTQTGYTKQTVKHEEGDVWEENGKQWTIKNGIKQNITRFDEIKKLLTLPITCPKCDKHMTNHPINKKMWPIHGMCFDCVIKMETELKRDGKWDEYQRNITKSSTKLLIKEMESLLLEVMLDSGKESFITEAGDIEEWRGGVVDKTKIAENIQEYIKKLKDILES